MRDISATERQNKKKDGFRNRPLQIVFVLPSIHDRPTGGNLYNRKLIEALEQEADVRTIIWKDAWLKLPENEATQLSVSDGVVVDSLLLDKIDILKNGLPGRHPAWFVLVHYLALCDPANTDEARREQEMHYLEMFNGFITTSHFSKRKLAEAGVSPERVTCVYPGLDDGYFDDPRPPEPGDCCRLLTVSSLLPGKGITDLIDILEALGDIAWKWTLVGDATLDPVYADFVQLKIEQSSMASRMIWLGSVDAAQMPACYLRHDLLVLASEFETLSMTTREALACGRPVIAFDVGGIRENMRQGGGILVPALDVLALKQEIRRLAKDPAIRALLGKQAVDNRHDYVDWRQAGQRFTQAIRSSLLL